jgi:hypothetical protein
VTRSRAIALLAAGCALAAAAAGTGPYLTDHPRDNAAAALARRAVAERQRRLLRRPGRFRPITRFEIAVELVFLVLIVVAVTYALYRLALLLPKLVRLLFRRSRGTVGTVAYDPGEESYDDAETALRDRVAGELAALSADLETQADPREVVIACYVRMERAFAASGAARQPTESPLELLERVLGTLHVPAADVRRLTALFSEARFSTHPVTDEMRAAARRSLTAVADALAVPA